MQIELIHEYSLHSKRVWQVAVSKHGSLFASCSSNGCIFVTNIKKKESFQLPGKSTKTIRSVAFSHDGRLLSSCGFDGTTQIWDCTNKFELVCTLEGHENEVKCVTWAHSFLPATSVYLLATCGRDKTIWIWAIEMDSFASQEILAILQEHSQDVKFIAFHPGVLASSSADESIIVWADVDDGIIGKGDGEWVSLATLRGNDGIVWQLAWLPPLRIASCAENGSVSIWAAASSSLLSPSWTQIFKISLTDRPCYSLAASPDYTLVAVGTGANSIALISIGKDIEVVCYLKNAHKNDINSIVWIDGGLILSASDDKLIKEWRVGFCRT